MARSKKKNQEARAKHRVAKRRARLKRVMEKYRGNLSWGDYGKPDFDAMILELSELNLKYLQQLVDDLTDNPGYGDPNKALRERVQLIIMERTLLK